MFKFVLSVIFIGYLNLANANDALCVGLAHGTHVNDDSSCAAYFTCLHGVATPQQCPEGLHFNPLTIICDHPETVRCQDGTVAPPTTTEDPEDPDKIEMFVCPPSGLHFFEHPQSCTLFIFCMDGKLSEETCGDLHWDQSRLTCDDIETVNCQTAINLCPDVDDFDNVVRLPSTVNCDS